MNPIGTIFDLKRFAVHDGPGVRTVVFLKGCPLSCAWCHNPEGQARPVELVYLENLCIRCGACAAACPNGARAWVEGSMVYHPELCTQCGRCLEACYAGALLQYGRQVSIAEVMETVRQDRDFYLDSGGGVTLSGGEPLAQPAFAIALLRQCKTEGFHTALDTSGFASWPILEAALSYTDLVLYDLKVLDTQQHRGQTGVDNTLILENLRRLTERKMPLEIRVPVVPGVNDGPNLAATGAFLRQLGARICVRLLPYHSLAGGKYQRLGRANPMPIVDSPLPAAMQAAAEVLRGYGCEIVGV